MNELNESMNAMRLRSLERQVTGDSDKKNKRLRAPGARFSTPPIARLALQRIASGQIGGARAAYTYTIGPAR